MGAGASAGSPSQRAGNGEKRSQNAESRKIQNLLSSIGKTPYLEKVVAAVNERENSSAVVADTAAAMAILDTIFASVAEMPDDDKVVVKGMLTTKMAGFTNISTDDLTFYTMQAICKNNTKCKAKAKFDELDVDKSGHLNGEELNTVVKWMFTMSSDVLQTGSAEEAEAKAVMMERIDADKNEVLSFDEFLILFEEEQRKSLMIKYAKAKFIELDANNSGNLDKEEITKLVDWLLDLTEEDFTDADKGLIKDELMVRVGDVQSDGSSVVSFENFVLLCEEEMERVELRRRAKEKFRELDKDSSGSLENAELFKVVEFMYHSLGCGTAKNKDAAKADMMQRVDANGDGKLDLNEFIALFEQVYIESNKPLEAIAVVG